ncbi:hypothetical protein [Shewanella sp. 0m-4]
MNNPSTVWITIIVAIGAFFVSGLSIYLGYDLFVQGASGEFQFSAESEGKSVSLISVAPGLGFALFGMLIAITTLLKTIGSSK